MGIPRGRLPSAIVRVVFLRCSSLTQPSCLRDPGISGCFPPWIANKQLAGLAGKGHAYKCRIPPVFLRLCLGGQSMKRTFFFTIVTLALALCLAGCGGN